MQFHKKSKGRQFLEQFNNSSSLSSQKIKIGGAYDEIKTEEQKTKDKNMSVIKIQTQPNSTSKTKISDEKLKRFINFRI